MKTYQIQIKGIVQGVGFRPFVYTFFTSKKINGWVNNTSNGVFIQINTNENINLIIDELLQTPPTLATITEIKIKKIANRDFNNFSIITSKKEKNISLLITPDFATCKDCENELQNKNDKRFEYQFLTCTNCGPRFSITKKLPYDREVTTMESFKMCSSCNKEYNNPIDRRYYSQTNSCKDCCISLELYKNEECIEKNLNNLDIVIQHWNAGKIIAIKGVGGYLLTCDATNTETIKRLRKIKNRPTKPFALMYHDIYELGEDVEMGIGEKLELEEVSSPIVLLSIKKDRMTPIDVDVIAPNLNILGVMMPYTPLFKSLLNKFKKPIIATSANISGDTIIYKDDFKSLSKISDYILTNNREIVIPQDDSVVRFSSIKSYRTIIRRSRGLAPSYINNKLTIPNKEILAMGSMLKSTFAITQNKNIHISQFLGNINTLEAENNYKKVLTHFNELFNPKYKVVLVDKHPNYFTTQYGRKIAKEKNITLSEIQHHKAHFFAVLAENNLLISNEKILGVIFDGTGFGNDGNIWGGEFFTYHKGKTKRVYHLNEFPFILGDKLPKEPRLSALVMTFDLKNNDLIKNKFTKIEWNIYEKLIENTKIKSTSIGRLFDAVASIVLGIDKQTYEGEAAMRLESAAYRYFRANNFTKYYSYFKNDILPNNFIQFIIDNILIDLEKGFQQDFIAAKFHITLAHYISIVAKKQGIKKVCFSGGVFQNQWLIELILSFMNSNFELFFHKNLSPNDENISFGQLMYYLYTKD